jgi:hypothetical protein
MTLEERVARIEKQMGLLAPKQEQWVGPTVITEATGWNSEQMRKARRNGSVKFRRSATGGYKYLLSSIPDHLIKKPSADTESLEKN